MNLYGNQLKHSAKNSLEIIQSLDEYFKNVSNSTAQDNSCHLVFAKSIVGLSTLKFLELPSRHLFFHIELTVLQNYESLFFNDFN